MPNFFLDNLSTLIFIILGILLVFQAFVLFDYIFQVNEKDIINNSETRLKAITISSNISILLGGCGISLCILSIYDIFHHIGRDFAFKMLHYISLGIGAVFAAFIWYFVPLSLRTDNTTLLKIESNLKIASDFSVALIGFLIGSIIFSFIKDFVNKLESEDPIQVLGGELIVSAVVLLVQSIACLIAYFTYGGENEGIFLFGLNYIYLIVFIGLLLLSIILIGLGIFLIIT